jgi:hypothetical protein
MKKILILACLFAAVAQSQIILQKEEMIGNVYRLSYKNFGTNRRPVQRPDGGAVKDTAASDTGKDELTTRSLLIALPPYSTPKVKAVVLSQTNAAPIGAAVASAAQSLACHVRGYVWVENFYCLHLEITPSSLDAVTHQRIEIQDFVVDLEFSAAVQTQSTMRPAGFPGVVQNTRYAAAWMSGEHNLTITRNDGWIDYTQEYLKLGVAHDGIYKLSYADLLAKGVPVGSVNPSAFKLILKGREIPLYVSTTNAGVFAPGDYVEFVGRRNYGDVRYRQINPYGTPYYEYLDPYTDTTIYWLSWKGPEGARVRIAPKMDAVPADTTDYYDALTHIENNVYWDYALDGGDVRKNYPDLYENKTWNEGSMGVTTLSKQFAVTDLSSKLASAHAYVKISDYASSINANAHDVAISINAIPTKYDSGFIDKYQIKVLKGGFPGTQLTNGVNSVNLQSFPTANTVNSIAFDWFELEYPRNLIAAGDSLDFAYKNVLQPKLTVMLIKGVSADSLSLYRFSMLDSSIVKIVNFTRIDDKLLFLDTLRNNCEYFLRATASISQPLFFAKKKFTNLRAPSHQAEYIAITHPYFLPTAQQYTSFIASTYHVSTLLVDVNDIYDEFNYGFLAPQPIRDFLNATHVYWQSPKPQYVFLIGKASYDFYGNKARFAGAPPVPDFIPSYGNPVSDTWYTIWDSTGALIPQMSIGRVPAKSLDEFQSYFTKHQKYVSKGYDEWNKRYIFFSGGNFTDPVQLAQSKAVNDAIINNYVAKPPIGGLIADFYKTASPISNFGPYSPEYIQDAIDQGGVFISYLGHSGTQTWDNSITDIGQLANIRDRNPLITDFGCSTGKFAEPDVLSFSELAVNDLKGQAIAYVGNSSLGFTSTAYTFPQVFYKKLLIDTSVSIGETHRLAKLDYIAINGTSSSYGLFILTNTLIGDPIIKLPIPVKANLSDANTTLLFTPARPTDQTDTLHVEFSYNNFGKAINDTVEILITDEFQSKSYFSSLVKRKVPRFADTITINIPIHMMPGEHRLTIKIDPAAKIDEIIKTDNTLVSTFIVASSNTRNLSIAPIANQSKGQLIFLNPTVRAVDSSFIVEVSTNSAFSPSQITAVPFDTFYTKFKFDQSQYGKRLWIKTKNAALGVDGLTYSYVFGDVDNYFINDSVSFSRLGLSNSKLRYSRIILDTSQISFGAISAGYNDGKTAVIIKDGQNFIPENTLTGHHVVLFDVTTFEYAGYYRFNTSSGGSEVTRYKAFLDTLTSKYLVIIAISDEGGLSLDPDLKVKLKTLGSIYIDSIGYRSSWAIIGRKGALPGTVPEKFSQSFAGRVQVDTTINIPTTHGTFETEPIGPVAEWKSAVIGFTNPPGTAITMSIVGVNSTDTLKSVTLTESTIDLSKINAQQYPAIKLVGDLRRSSGQPSPSVNSIAVNYNQLAELGTNYQSVKSYLYDNGTQGKELSAGDTVAQGGKILLKYRVYNAGGSAAKKFGIQAAAVWENNNTEAIANGVVDSLPPQAYQEYTALYNTALGYGRRSLRITIDPDTLIRELFKDNNIYVFPIYVKKDSSKPLLPNLTISPQNIFPVILPITDEKDSARFALVYSNTGAYVNDSITISVRQFYLDANVTSWTIRRKYPAESDTVFLTVPILKRAGTHQLQVELDPFGLIVESTKSDNVASYYFTVATTDFKILQPTSFSAAAYTKIIFLNPTSQGGAATRIADFELDTLNTFGTSRKAQLPMQEFTTTYDVPSLANRARYYWRIKQEGSGKDWTTGTFYLGESAAYSIGQSDSIAWKANAYDHAQYAVGGGRIADLRTDVKAVSAGFSDGRTGSIEVNGVNVLSPVFGTGHNVIVIDTGKTVVTARRRFDISNNADDADSLIQFLSSIAPGFIVSDVVVDEGANNLKPSARDALKSIGSASIDKLAYRDSWAIIGRKGAAPGSVPESYVPQFTGTAAVETTLVKKAYQGRITTPAFGPLSHLSAFSLTGGIPAGASVQTMFVGTRYNNLIDTIVLTSGNTVSNPHIGNSVNYKTGTIVFTLQTAGVSNPSITGWTLIAQPPVELAVSDQSASINRAQVMEGEAIVFTGKIFNVGSAPADSVTVQLATNENGFDKILKTQQYPVIQGYDSAIFAYTYSSRAKGGNYAFTFTVDPLDSIIELSKNNNAVTIPFTVLSDTLRPQLQVDIDGIRVIDGDYVSQHPVISIRYADNNPSSITKEDSSNFKIRLNNAPAYFTPGIIELITGSAPGTALVNWTPELGAGENIIQIHATDVAGNSSDTTLLFVNVASTLSLADVYNLPNPFAGSTQFTFNMLGPVNPDEVSVKIFTVAGRLIQDIPYYGKIGFNKIYWDGRDKDGDELANGVYFYKIIVKQGDKQTSAIGKLVKMR